ncbi:AAA family ATPase, partial [bacterium]|nr:AAA family ATPase [bacterium]
RSITFHNFRSFYGEQEIEFGINDDDYLTIIHAQNGSGKTNLLNAILWTFYELTTGKFNEPDKLLNETARLEGATTTWVEVKFSHLKSMYVARRSHVHGKPNENRDNLRINKIERDGNTVPQDYPQTFIESVIPPDIARYFFFDGEHAENFGGAASKSRVGEAIKNILGCSILETAITDLGDLEKLFERELKQALQGQGSDDLLDEIKALEETISTSKEQIQASSVVIASQEERLIDIRGTLKQLSASREFQADLEKTQRDLATAESNKTSAENKLIRWADKNALPLVSRDLIDSVAKIVNENKIQNRIPEKYAAPVIQELLEEEKCICGTCLEKGSEQRAMVQALLVSSADEGQISRSIRVQSEVRNLQKNIVSSEIQFKEAVEAREKAIWSITKLEEHLATINKSFTKIDDSEIAGLRKKDKEISFQLESFRASNTRAKITIEDKEKLLKVKNSELAKVASKQKIAEIHDQKLHITRGAKVHLDKQLEEHVNLARRVITQKVNTLLSKVAHKPMKIEIEKDFTLKLLYGDGIPLPQSAGEDQLVGLLFTAALIDFSKDREKAGGSTLIAGTVAPLFLDAPFGQLDNSYQEKIAEILPELADQLCLMLSGSQGRKEVLEKLLPFGGRQLVIVRHNKADAPINFEEEEVSLGGRSYTQTLWNQKHDGSFFVSVS